VTFDAFSDGVLGWLVRGAGLLWLFGAFALFRQIQAEMALDAMASKLGKIAKEMEADAAAHPPPPDADFLDNDAPSQPRLKSDADRAEERWIDRDDTARRGWIAGQAVVLAATAIAMLMLHPVSAWLAALLVMGLGVYFIWREYTARHAPSPKAAEHARPSTATINAGWVSLFVAGLVWMAAFRGLLG
jgi:ABC-type nickel/cobalt efflux system permease component RcnA